MSFRGRGRGRGRGRFGGGGGGFGFARQEPFVEFPEVKLPDRKEVKEERALVIGNAKLVNFWKSSPYYLEETVSKKNQGTDIERFSDWGKPKTASKRDALGNFLLLRPSNFPKELIAGAKREGSNPKKVRWDTDVQKLDMFEKLEQKYQGREEKGEKENKEGEDEEEDEDEEAEEAEEEFSDDDYLQNENFDDDDDDYNDADDGDNDEPEY